MHEHIRTIQVGLLSSIPEAHIIVGLTWNALLTTEELEDLGKQKCARVLDYVPFQERHYAIKTESQQFKPTELGVALVLVRCFILSSSARVR